MIVISLLLFLLGVGLLAAGLVIESIQLEAGAVASALMSALALYAGVRQRRTPTGQDEPAEAGKAALTEPLSGLNADEIWSPPPDAEHWPTDPVVEAPAVEAPDTETPDTETPDTEAPAVETSAVEASAPAEQDPVWGDDDAHSAEYPGLEESDEAQQGATPDATEAASPDDEPDEEDVSPANVARVAARSDDVLVIDGRPRYHRRACAVLLGREVVPIPVSEARESGFTPCARCRPDAHLLRGLRRPTRR